MARHLSGCGRARRVYDLLVAPGRDYGFSCPVRPALRVRVGANQCGARGVKAKPPVFNMAGGFAVISRRSSDLLGWRRKRKARSRAQPKHSKRAIAREPFVLIRVSILRPEEPNRTTGWPSTYPRTNFQKQSDSNERTPRATPTTQQNQLGQKRDVGAASAKLNKPFV